MYKLWLLLVWVSASRLPRMVLDALLTAAALPVAAVLMVLAGAVFAFAGADFADRQSDKIFGYIQRFRGLVDLRLGQRFVRLYLRGGWCVLSFDGVTVRRFVGDDAEKRARFLFESSANWMALVDPSLAEADARCTCGKKVGDHDHDAPASQDAA